MHQEIENLINMALADGEVTEKERGIIMRKAEALGEDKDEVEMILDGKIALLRRELNLTQQTLSTNSNKEGHLRKCPSCGAPVQSFATKCSECGHEFRGIDADSSVQKLFTILQSIDQEERSKPRQKSFAQMLGDMDIEKENAIANRQALAINSFPVPNSKESILEFLSMALPQTKIKLQKLMFMTAPIDKGKETIKKAWTAKCEQIIMKARFSMKDDKQILSEIEFYAKQLGIK